MNEVFDCVGDLGVYKETMEAAEKEAQHRNNILICGAVERSPLTCPVPKQMTNQ